MLRSCSDPPRQHRAKRPLVLREHRLRVYRMTKQISDEHIFNTFNNAQYSLMQISQPQDFWEWGNGAHPRRLLERGH